MNHQPRILVFETSALLATLSLFTDHYTYDPEALEHLLDPITPGEAPLLDRIVIPDHVLYELTGILPICFPEMLHRFKSATHNPDALTRMIDLYALASPRGEVNDPTDDQKSHVRMLLRFVANHPDCIVPTSTSRAYCQRLKADFAVLGSSNEHTVAQYRPTFADAFHYLGDAFHDDALRVHAGQLLMMGMINEMSYNERMSKLESSLSKQQRFYKTEEFLTRVTIDESHRKNGNGKNGNGKTGFIPSNLADHIKQQEDEGTKHHADLHNGYLKMGLFKRHPQLLRLMIDRFQSTAQSGVYPVRPDDETLYKNAFGPSHMLMEHYIHGGILPNTNTALFIAAAALGFDLNGLHQNDDYAKINGALYDQGFYEVSPTLAQLRLIHAACVQLNVAAPVLGNFIAAIPNAEHAATQRFREACKHPNDHGLAQQTELRMPHIGLPYEKVFGDALINGALSWDEFQKLIQEVNGLPRRIDAYIGSQSADILLKPSSDPKQAMLCIAQDGFVGRTGKTQPNVYISRATCALPVGHEQRLYYMFSAQNLIDRCHLGLTDHRVSSKLYRTFETMLYRASTQDASRLRDNAVKLLGEDRVVQLEKDFANRHARRSLQVQPPFASLFTALHTNSRILRKNLGEVATFEASAQVIGANPDAHVWVANHDSDLFSDPQRHLQLEDSVIRQHSGLNPHIRDLNAAMAKQPQLHLVNTEQFLDTLHQLMGLQPRKHYDVVSAKPLILNHRSRSWAAMIDTPLAATRQR